MRYLLIALVLVSCSSLQRNDTRANLSMYDQAAAVVMVMGPFGGGTGFGVVSPYTGIHYILSNAHVCEIASAVRPLHSPMYAAKILKIAEDTDLCLLEAGYLEPALEISSTKPQPFDPIHVLGYGLLLPLTLTEGHYVGTMPGPVLRVMDPGYGTASILPGNSGSPVLNTSGEVIGVAFASAGFIDNRVIMVSLKDIYKFMEGY